MAKLFDYLTLRGDVTFKYAPFNVVDALLLSQISYIDFSQSSPRFLSEKQENLQEVVKNVFSTVKKEEMVLGLIVPNTILELADAGKDTLRFKDVRISNYIDIVDKKKRCQFSAMCFHLPNNTIYIAFRGTDDSLIGWQEDLDMLCKFPIPAQVEAAKYVDKIAKIFPTSVLILGGHSKGGNLAAYASIYCKDNVKIRIKDVYCFDSPGFDLNNIDEKKYKIIKKRITRIIPQSSVIGLIFDNIATKTIIVKSDGKGITQHDAFSWHVTHNHFVKVDALDENASKFDEALKKMIAELSEEDRYDLASNCYTLVKQLDQETLLEIQKNPMSLMKEIDWSSLSFGYMKTDYNVRCWYRNGAWGEIEISSEETLNIHMAATCLHYGQEAFEGLKAYRCPDGKVRVFRMDENAARLQSSCRGIMMPELPIEKFEEMVTKVVRLNEAYIPPYESGASLYIRPLLIGTGAQVGVKPANEYLFIIFVTPVGPYFKGGFSANPYAITRKYDRAAPLGTGIYKVGGNYAASLCASKEAHDAGYAAEFYLDAREKKFIDECGAANFFGIKDNTYITPASTSILPSITNKSLIQLAEDLGLKVERRPIAEEELETFEEAGACGTAAVISPIQRIDDPEKGKSYVFSEDGKPGPISTMLYNKLRGVQYGIEPDVHGWTKVIIE